MKKAIIAVLALLPSFSQAQVQGAIWDVELITEIDVSSIELDIRADGNFLLVNGIIRTSENTARAAVGSCFYIASLDDYVCELDVRGYTYTMRIRNTLDGSLEIADDGVVIDEGNIFFRQ